MKQQGSKVVEIGQEQKLSRELFQNMIHTQVRRAILAIMEREVDGLCGVAYRPDAESLHHRAGSEKGRYYFDGEAHEVIRPRVRAQGREVRLKSYQMARNRQSETPELIRMIEGGMSFRGIARLNRRGFSASTAQTSWMEESAKGIERLRGRDLSQEQFFAVMVDGVQLSRELVVVVAIGFCVDGSKKVLDFVVGSTENYEVCRDLMQRLIRRGFRSVSALLLAVIDGGGGIRKAILEFFPEAKIQRCLVHKERNLHSYLRWRDRGECSRFMNRLRKAEGREAGQEAYQALATYLQERNQAAYQSLLEAGDDLLTFHRLNAPATLNTTFLSTNAIENVMRNFRRHTGRVHRWRPQTNQAERWTATALLMAEEGFHKIRFHQEIPKLLAALGQRRTAVAPDCVTDSTLRVADPSDQTSSTPSGAK